MRILEAHQYALDVCKKYGITDLPIEWDNSRSRLGVCQFSQNTYTKVIKRKVIFSRLLFANISEEEQIDTILHEIAHARLPHTVGHGPGWQALHRAMGGTGNRCHKGSQELVAKVSKWIAYCPVETSKVVKTSNRLTDNQRSLLCACHRQRIVWRDNS